MKKLLIISFILILMLVSVSAKTSNYNLISKDPVGNSMSTPLHLYSWSHLPGMAQLPTYISFILYNEDTLTLNDVSLNVNTGNGDDFTFNFAEISANAHIPITVMTTYLDSGNYIVQAIVTYNSASESFATEISIDDAFFVSGYVFDIFDETPISNALLTFHDPLLEVSTTTDSNGYYEIEVFNEDYIPVTIEHDDYTPFHTWYDNNLNLGKDYTLIPTYFNWELYNVAFRNLVACTLQGYGRTNCQWGAPPGIIIFEDSFYVGGLPLDDNIGTLLYNLNHISNNFNPRDILSENIVLEESFRLIEDGEVGIKWDNSVSAGSYAVVFDGLEPMINRGIVIFNYIVDPLEPDNRVYNQEIGSVFGATNEPRYNNYDGSPYDTIFHEFVPAGMYTYTEMDLQCAQVYLNRSRIHYWNEVYDEEDLYGYDWEIRPDLVTDYYPFGKTSSPGRVLVSYEKKGKQFTEEYNYFETPVDVMKMFPEIFSNEDIKKSKSLKKEIRKGVKR